jgi:hypothetical protein
MLPERLQVQPLLLRVLRQLLLLLPYPVQLLLLLLLLPYRLE